MAFRLTFWAHEMLKLPQDAQRARGGLTDCPLVIFFRRLDTNVSNGHAANLSEVCGIPWPWRGWWSQPQDLDMVHQKSGQWILGAIGREAAKRSAP